MDKVHLKLNKKLFSRELTHFTVALKLYQLDNAADRIRKIYRFIVRGSK